MPEIEHNGDDFKYVVNYQSLDYPNADTITEEINDWHQRELVVRDVGTYKQFLVSVQAANSMGRSPANSLTVKKVHSGEDSKYWGSQFPTKFGCLNIETNVPCCLESPRET